MRPEGLAAAWRNRADQLEAYAPSAARAFRAAAEELEARDRADDEELLTLSEAARRSRYSQGHIGRMLRNGTIENAGRKGAPRIRAGDLPRKPGSDIADARSGPYDPIADARNLLRSRREAD